MRVRLTLLLFALLAAPGWAQDPVFLAEVNARRIGLQDTLIYRLIFRGIDQPISPELRNVPGFQVLHRSHSSSFEYSGGRSTHTSTFIFYLKPTRTGSLEIPAAHTVAGGREYKTAAFPIEVVAGKVLPAPARPANPFIPPWEEEAQGPDAAPVPGVPDADQGELRLEATLSKKTVVTGEPVIYTVHLLTQQAVDSVDLVSSPSFPGFWQEWLPVPGTVPGKTELRNGKTFQVFEIRKAILFPGQTGTLDIPAMQFSITSGGGPLGLFSGSRPIDRSTQPLRLTVKPPPPPARGLPVGRFELTVAAASARADAGEFFPVRITVSGDGNVKTLAPPGLPSSPDYRAYPAKIESRYDGGDPPKGTLTAEIPVAFLRTGQVTFPAVELRFFDPVRGQVETVRSQPFTVTVSGEIGALGAPSAKAPPPPAREKPAPAVTAPLAGDPDRIPGGKGFWLLVALPFLFPLAWLGKRLGWDTWRRRHPSEPRDRALRETLAMLERGASIGDLPPAIAHYLSLRLNTPAGGATPGEIDAILNEHGISSAPRQRLLDLWQEASRRRYSQAPGTAESEVDWRLEAGSMLRVIDREWR